ncbi:hypothetical protein [Pseudomonas soli]
MTEPNQGLNEILASEIQVSILENTAGFFKSLELHYQRRLKRICW